MFVLQRFFLNRRSIEFSLQSVNSMLPNSFFEKKFPIYLVGKYDLHTFETNL